MATLSKLIVKLVTDVSEFEAGMASAQKKLEKMADTAGKIGDKLSTFVTLPILAAGTAAVKFASDVNESLNKSNAIFEQSADVITKWSETASTSFGMSQGEALDAASSFGGLFKTVGLGTDKAAEMSKSLVQLAADLGSFNNISSADALEKLRSGLAGETEPLRSLNVFMNEAAVRAKAMQLGLVGANGQLSEQAKILARYAIIMEQTKPAQGDFEKTQYSLANLMKTLQSLGKDVLADFGSALLPAIIGVMKGLIPILKWFNDLPDSTKNALVTILVFAAAFGPVISVGARLFSTFSGFLGLFKAGGALAGALPWITGTLLPALQGIPGAAAAAGTSIGAIGVAALPVIALIAAVVLLGVTIWKLGPQALGTIQTIIAIFGLLPQFIGIKLQDLGPVFGNGIRTAVNWILSRVGDLNRAGQALMVGLISGIISYSITLVQTVMRVVQSVINAVKKMLGIASPSKVFAGYGQNMMLGMERGIRDFSARPVLATVKATAAVKSPGAAISSRQRGGGFSVGPILISGDLSATAKEDLRAEMQAMFTGMMAEVMQ